MLIDTFYYFDKSTKRKNELASYCTLCDVEVRKVLKHVSTRWLSLELVVSRILQQYPALRSYFLSQGMCTDVLGLYEYLICKNSVLFGAHRSLIWKTGLPEARLLKCNVRGLFDVLPSCTSTVY